MNDDEGEALGELTPLTGIFVRYVAFNNRKIRYS